MKKINFCIILYNKKISDSKSINSLIKYYRNSNDLCNIVVFNNGPNLVNEEYSEFIILNQILVNASLSKIYNKFIEEYISEYYVLLDDDTVLNKEYLDELQLNTQDIFIPRIHSANIEYYPVINNKNIQTITSGLCLSSNFCQERIRKNSSVFDERFDLYGIDTAFCYIVNKLNLKYTISRNSIEHDLSHISSGDNSFREVEVLLSNSASLISYFNFRLLALVLYGQLKMIKKLKFKVLLSSIVSFALKRTIRIWKLNDN